MSAAATVLALALAGGANPPPGLKPVRSDEDYGYLRDVSDRAGLDSLRYVPLGGDAYLSLGGEVADTFALGRLLLSADLHLTPAFRVYGALGFHRDIGKRAPATALDRDGVDRAARRPHPRQFMHAIDSQNVRDA